MLVDVKNAVFGYAGRPVVQARELCLHGGRRLGMFGPNGSGKTTLVRGLTGLLPPMSGCVIRQPGIRMGYLPQHRSMEMHWPMSGMDAASMACSARRRWGWMDSNTTSSIQSCMRQLEVAELADRPFRSLSGGQQQRLLLSGALAAKPQLLVLDEPTEGLDVRSRRIFLSALRQAAAGGLSTIFISHAVDDLIALCDEIAWLLSAEDADGPNGVEIVSAAELARRITAGRMTA